MRSDIAATSEEVLKFSNGTVEAIAVYLQRKNLFIASLYRQPDNPTHRSTAYELSQALSKIESAIESIQGTPTVMIGGDFNLPTTEWTDGQTNMMTRTHVHTRTFAVAAHPQTKQGEPGGLWAKPLVGM